MFPRSLVPLLLAVCLVAGCGGGGGGDDPTPTPGPTETPAAGAPGTPEAALGAYVQQTFQKEFVADCAKAVVATDAGKLCGTFKADKDNWKAYTIGLVASEGSQWVILQNTNNNWTVASSQMITPDTAAIP